MKAQHKLHMVLGALVLTVSGCTTKFYVPNTQNVPIIESRGQTNLTFAGNGNQVEFQGAYGLTDGLALQVNGDWVIPDDLDDGSGGSGRFGEGGLGYFERINDDFLFDTYALAGFGKMENHFPTSGAPNPTPAGIISANLTRFSLQPSLSFHRKYFSITGSARVSSLGYAKIAGVLTLDDIDQVAYLQDNKSNFLIEPALTIRGGLEKIKIQVQLLHSFNLSHSDFRQDDGLVSVGLNFNFK